ncbi:MAG: hypothetical protein H8E55_55810 [Pelagibacterales bacterium]|nr:hypothetical protein [Pelagibacterales bacterium]
MNNETREIHTSQSSTEFNINAKGQWSAKIKAYADTAEEAVTIAETQARKIETILKEKNS